MYLLDTNHCSYLIEGEAKVVNYFRELGKVRLATCAIVAGELRFMAQNSQQKTANLIKIRAFLSRIDIYPIDDETAEIYGDLKTDIIKKFAPKEKSKRQKTQLQEIGIGENDLWIAATALRHSLILVTSDSDFQRMRQVREFPVESWI
ncbi:MULTISPECIES: type II toxin-antitoxin system VapC family toxin [Calothrix]|uniref:Ribonuclease VapC n=2 Tax=Calothrix TaxID=1186 RepID=A0ABR8AD12_9CYAN|nr:MULTISPECIES: type II toxin-antitoxin system VapC family toxin [Calothrix]MBD2197370.1 type II toxin-antitoxin system VapC family toxin [Calothrix parietina FACHB-288]MBD2228172.1 type II toxin-antitoxin system VapC family toxin [Calothrix anomala FACHB-343]